MSRALAFLLRFLFFIKLFLSYTFDGVFLNRLD